MNTRFVMALTLLLMSMLACNLASGDAPTSPANVNPIGNNGGINPTATSNVVFVTATPAISATTAPTATSTTTSGGTSGGPSGGTSGGTTGSPVFSGLSFSTSAAGVNMTTFPNGTEEVYARWNYSNVPVGTTMRRVWYRDGNVIVSRDESWSSNWGTTGRLTHIKLFDYEVGLTPGNYYVVVSLPSYGITIDGNFTITAGAPAFSNLSTSMTRDGANMTSFPYGTEEVFIRWDYSNIPAGAIVQREWYRDGVAVATRSEAWGNSWGANGRLTHISLYDFDSGFGLSPGNYRVVVYLRDYSTVRLETTFTIGANVGPTFSNLRFATTPNSVAAVTFAAGTKRVYAIWEYANIPVGAQVRRVWKRNGAIYAERTLAWDFNAYGTNGTVTDVYIFDDINGLPSGTYNVEVSIVGQAGVILTGNFTIQ